jgi:hypothetical protein
MTGGYLFGLSQMVKRKHLFLPESIHRLAWDKNKAFLVGVDCAELPMRD